MVLARRTTASIRQATRARDLFVHAALRSCPWILLLFVLGAAAGFGAGHPRARGEKPAVAA